MIIHSNYFFIRIKEVAAHAEYGIWIGIYGTVNDTWAWSDKSAMLYENWYRGNVYNEEYNCVMVSKKIGFYSKFSKRVCFF